MELDLALMDEINSFTEGILYRSKQLPKAWIAVELVLMALRFTFFFLGSLCDCIFLWLLTPILA
jgi:hypothetical protein